MVILTRLLRYLHRSEDAMLIASLVIMLTIALGQILLRNLFDSGVLWAESLSRILVLWVAMLGAMVATRESNHINIDAVSRYLPRRLKTISTVFTQLIACGVCAAVAWYALEFVRFEYEDRTIAFAEVPNWVCQAILPIGFGVMSVRFLLHSCRAMVRG